MSPLFKEIPDLMIAAFAPLTGRLTTRINRNMKATAIYAIRTSAFFVPFGGTTGTGTSFTTVATLRIFTPLAGNVRLSIGVAGDKEDGAGTSEHRILEVASGASSAPLAMSANTTFRIDLVVLDFVSVADTIREFAFQGRIVAVGPGPGVGVTVSFISTFLPFVKSLKS